MRVQPCTDAALKRTGRQTAEKPFQAFRSFMVSYNGQLFHFLISVCSYFVWPSTNFQSLLLLEDWGYILKDMDSNIWRG